MRLPEFEGRGVPSPAFRVPIIENEGDGAYEIG